MMLKSTKGAFNKVLVDSSDLITQMYQNPKNLRKNYDTSYHTVYRILKKSGVVVSSAVKSKKRKWVRFERKYSNVMWRVDWHTMKDPRFKGLNLVTYLDAASRCITGAAL